MRVAGPCLLLLVLAALPQPASADEAVSVELAGTALRGQALPRLIVTVKSPVAGLRLFLERSDGARVERTFGASKPGQTRTFDLSQPEGTFHYEGALEARFAKGAPQKLPLTFDATLLGPPKLEVARDAVDLAAHTVTFTSDREVAELQLRVESDAGAVLDEHREGFPGSKAGEPLVAHWNQPEGARVLRISLRVTDKFGYFQDVDLFPWHIDIPHEDVLFETGRSEIVDTEKPKLESAFGELAKAIQLYGRFAKVGLFIAGHTDTVGDPGSNAALSEARAKAIASWFRKRGVKFAISYAGLGESNLLVQTPDETDEPRNRRAQYVVSIDPPGGFGWKHL